MSIYQATLFAVLLAMCAWAVLSPHVRTGLACTAGLICIALAAMACLDGPPLTTRETLLATGVAIIGARAAWRHLRRGVDEFLEDGVTDP